MDELKNAAKEKMQRKEISEKQRLQLKFESLIKNNNHPVN